MLTTEINADIAELRQPGNREWARWSMPCRAAWARSMLKVCEGLDIRKTHRIFLKRVADNA
jgi:hypothetical protein